MKLSFKRGDTFRLAGTVKLGGVLQDMTGWTLKAQVRKWNPNGPSDLIAELDASWANESAAALELEKADTTAWPVGEACMDVRLTSPGGEKTTTTIARFTIENPATQDG